MAKSSVSGGDPGRTSPETKPTRYAALIDFIFRSHFDGKSTEIMFRRDELTSAAEKLGIKLPKNLGDVIYSFRYRTSLPSSIANTAREGHVWIIRPAGQGKYLMAMIPDAPIVPTPDLDVTKIADSTPGIVAKYSLNDEQALLAKVRYNRLVDIFTGVTCYSLQNHLRTTVEGLGQVETDEVYIGIDRYGAHYVFPVQAKGGSDRLNIVQIEQDLALCAAKFPGLNCTAIAAQFIPSQGGSATIALFGFQERADGAKRVLERHYRLVPPEQITRSDLEKYGQVAPGGLEILRSPSTT